MDKIAVLIPCYNEAKTIKTVIKDFQKSLPDATIYVYDNNSTDDTVKIAKKAGAVVRHEYAQGKGNVIRRMFREIDAEVYLMVDGDDTYDAKNAKEMVAPVLNGEAEMTVGDRLSSSYFTENKRPFHNSGNSVVRFSVNKIFRVEFKDIMTGYRAMSYNFVKTFPVLSKGFEIETEMSIHAAFRNMKIKNVTIGYKDRPAGSESKLNTIPDGLKVLKTIASLFSTYRPMLFFGLLTIILLIISAALLIPVLATYMDTGLVPRFPSLIVGCFTLLFAFLTLNTGITLKKNLAKDSRDFEFKLITADFQHKTLK